MKPPSKSSSPVWKCGDLRRSWLRLTGILAVSALALLGIQRAQATTLFWDLNGTTANIGTSATGTWDGTLVRWNSDLTGGAGGTATATTSNADDLIFSSGSGYTTGGTITLSGARVASSITFEENEVYTLSGGTSLTIGGTGGSDGIFLLAAEDQAVGISTALILNGNNTIQTAGTGVLTINGGVTGTGDLILNNNSTNAAGITISTVSLNNTGTVTNSGIGSGGVTISSVIGTSVTGVIQNSATSTLTLSGTNTYTGLTDVQAGTLALGASNVFANASTLKVSGGTLSLVGNSDTVAGVQLTSGSITSTTGVLTSTTAFDLQSGTVSAILGGSVGVNKTTAGTVTLTANNTYTGATSVNGGTLIVSGGSADIAQSSSITVNNGATLRLVSAGAEDKIGNSAGITMNGGTFDYNHPATNNVDYTETAGALSINSGASTITASTANIGGSESSVLSFASLARTVGATVNFTAGPDATTEDSNNIRFGAAPTLVNSIIGGYATIGGTDWATYTTGGNASVEALVTYVTTTTNGNTAANYTNDNIDVTSSPTLSGVITPNSFRFNDATARTVTLTGTTNTITSGGILVTAAATAGGTITGGTLGGASGTDLVVNQNSTGLFTINSVIANNGAATALTKSGTGTLVLGGANTYSGATFVNGGTMTLSGASGALTNTSSVTINTGGTLLLSSTTAAAGGQINDAAAVTLDGGTLQLGTNGMSETVGALTLSSSSVIDFGTLSGTNNLTFSNVNTWSGTLSVWNWTASTDHLYFGSTLGLNPTQINFFSGSNGTGYLGTGGFGPGAGEVSAVPEPSAVLMGLTLLSLAGWRERRWLLRCKAARRNPATI